MLFIRYKIPPQLIGNPNEMIEKCWRRWRRQRQWRHGVKKWWWTVYVTNNTHTHILTLTCVVTTMPYMTNEQRWRDFGGGDQYWFLGVHEPRTKFHIALHSSVWLMSFLSLDCFIPCYTSKDTHTLTPPTTMHFIYIDVVTMCLDSWWLFTPVNIYRFRVVLAISFEPHIQ